MSKLREALSEASIALSWATHGHLTEDDAKECLEVVDAALAEPVLNCEVGTMAEQSKRHEEYCKAHTTNGRCVKCPLWQMRLLGINCAVAWSQMPYEKGGEE
jgi:hypothetical protein